MPKPATSVSGSAGGFELQDQAMDVLSDVLSTLRLRGEGLYRSEMSAPWGLSFSPDDAHFHVIEHGTCLLQSGNSKETLRLSAGDLVILPQPRGHRLLDARTSQVVPLTSLLEARRRGKATGPLRSGGGGAATTFLCGRYHFDARLASPALSGFPPVLHVPGTGGRPVEWLELTIRFLASEAHSNAPGRRIALSRLMDLLFVEAIRYWLVTTQERLRGWVGALRDPRIGAALVRIHEQPERDWDVEALAREVAMSRSSFAHYFVELVGESPSRYLTRWRMQLAAHMLQTPGATIAQIAERVGYDSEAAFSRAFKRYMRTPPAAFRDQSTRNNPVALKDRKSA